MHDGISAGTGGVASVHASCRWRGYPKLCHAMEKGRKAAMLRAAVSLPLSVVSGMRCGRNRCKRGLFPVARIHPDGDGAVIDEFHLHVGPEDARSDRSAEELREPLRKDAVERQGRRFARRADVRRAIAFFVEAISVNWLTARTSPPTCRMSRFITPSASSKIRSPAHLRTSHSMSSTVSSSAMPTRMSMPAPIRETSSFLTETEARRTR